MQLDLFSDNRRTILLNDAETMLRSLDFEKALAVYADLIQDHPGDGDIRRIQSAAERWRDMLAPVTAGNADIGHLNELWLNLGEETPPCLAVGILDLVVAELKRLPTPEMVYVPPRFHIGMLLMSLKDYREAEQWFARALESGTARRGRFLAWRGDALTLMRDAARARDAYLSAFLEGPDDVDQDALESREVRHLIFSLEIECGDEIHEDEAASWLPVWGCLHGVFPLAMEMIAGNRDTWRAALDGAENAGNLTRPALWLEYLRYAEYLRTVHRDDRELVRVRRRMRRLCGIMFEWYMAKIRGELDIL